MQGINNQAVCFMNDEGNLNAPAFYNYDCYPQNPWIALHQKLKQCMVTYVKKNVHTIMKIRCGKVTIYL